MKKHSDSKRMEVPHEEIKKLFGSLPNNPHVHDKSGNVEPIVPASGDLNWLETYELDGAEEYPDFDPSRYYCLGAETNQGNYWLLDLQTGNVVYYNHETGYDQAEFVKVASSLGEFGGMISTGKNK